MRFFPRVWLIILSLIMAPILFAGSPSTPQDQSITSPASVDSADDYPINLIIPVEGVRANELRDTFNAPRSGGRLHRAIDIMAQRGTPVLAAADGEIIRVSRNKAGGNTIYQMSENKKLVFYYAHLDAYADDLAPGDYARQGDVIGYVGDTGNAGAGVCHLHFSIWAITDPKKLWQGDNINPYPILRETR
jgi:murein DD-endopeptidase MepM/ murein hydrolase activator NlpD